MRRQTQPAVHRSAALGFTLIEMLVALLIFAMLSVAGWKIFDSLNRLKAHNQQRAATLSAIQNTYSQLLRDLSQASPRPVRSQGSIDPALVLQADKLVFTRSGVFDPFNQQSSEQERVTYRYDPSKKQLLRYHTSLLDQSNPVTPAATVLLKDVDSVVFKALDPAESAQWPANQIAVNDPLYQFGDNRLPAGVSIDLTIKDQAVNWRFSLVKNLPRSLTVGSLSTSPAATASNPAPSAAQSVNNPAPVADSNPVQNTDSARGHDD